MTLYDDDDTACSVELFSCCMHKSSPTVADSPRTDSHRTLIICP